MKALSFEEFENAINEGAVVLDTRHPDLYEKGSIRYSLNIGLDGQYAVWVGSLIDIDQPIVLVTEDGKAFESILRLARVGFENVVGYLDGGIKTWAKSGKAVQKIESIAPEQTVNYMNQGYEVLDVRRNTETETEHVEGALNIPLVELKESLDKLDKNGKYLVHCAGGYRSMVAASILKSAGINNILNVYHGFDVMKTIEGIPLVAGKCPNQLRKERFETINFEE
jgi:rhodanese-related sulfurtransferase